MVVVEVVVWVVEVVEVVVWVVEVVVCTHRVTAPPPHPSSVHRIRPSPSHLSIVVFTPSPPPSHLHRRHPGIIQVDAVMEVVCCCCHNDSSGSGM
ncbi:hypothetical protein BDZ89DRAFT_1076111, partial [Hymenopellis radicata]